MFQFTQSVQFVSETGEPLEQITSAQVSNQRIAEALFNIATILDMQQANPYRIAAYRNAARGILALREPVAPLLVRGEAPAVPGLGERLRRKITELAVTGHMTFYDDLCEESLPDDVRELMRTPHIGPRIALRLTGQLGIHSLPELIERAQRHELRQHYGFGARSEQRLLDSALAVLSQTVAATPTPDDHAPATSALRPVAA